MEIKLTAMFRKFPEGYAAFVEDLPGANTQGATLEEARENLREARDHGSSGEPRAGRRIVAWSGSRARTLALTTA